MTSYIAYFLSVRLLLLYLFSLFNQLDVPKKAGPTKSGTNFECEDGEASLFLFIRKSAANIRQSCRGKGRMKREGGPNILKYAAGRNKE
jgi:hypothetical protein